MFFAHFWKLLEVVEQIRHVCSESGRIDKFVVVVVLLEVVEQIRHVFSESGRIDKFVVVVVAICLFVFVFCLRTLGERKRLERISHGYDKGVNL